MKFNPHVLQRLSWRVPLIAICWALPTFLDVSPERAEQWQAACLVALVSAFASWQSTQGKRSNYKPNGRDQSG